MRSACSHAFPPIAAGCAPPRRSPVPALLDAAGNLTEVIDQRGNTFQFLYNALNRKTVTIDGAGDRTTLLLDAAGNITQVTAGNNHSTQYLVDAQNRSTVT